MQTSTEFAETATCTINTNVMSFVNWIKEHTFISFMQRITAWEERSDLVFPSGDLPPFLLPCNRDNVRAMGRWTVVELFVGELYYDEEMDRLRVRPLEEIEGESVCGVAFELLPVGTDRLKVRVCCDRPDMPSVMMEWRALLTAVAETWPEAEDQLRPYLRWTLRESVRQRFELYRTIRLLHPEWGYARIAAEANRWDRSNTHSAYTVRKAYRSISEKWRRYPRIR